MSKQSHKPGSTKFVSFRVSVADHTKIKKAAISYGLSVSDFVLKCSLHMAEVRMKSLRDLDRDLTQTIKGVKFDDNDD